MRKLNRFALAFVAVLAMSAVVASAAQAVPQFTASAYPAIGTGSNKAGSETFTTEAGTVQCDSHFRGVLTEASSTLTVTPKYTECVAFGFLGATVNTEGCTYVFHATEKVENNVYRAHVDVSCPEGQSIKITAATCKAEVKSQTGLTTVKGTNLAGGSVTVEPNVTNIAMTVTQDGFGCPFSGTGAKTGSYHGDVVVSRVVEDKNEKGEVTAATTSGSVSVSGE
jgi:hypothetical protein